MNKLNSLIFNRIGLALHAIVESTKFNRIFLAIIALISIILFYEIFRQMSSGFWLLVLFVIIVLDFILTFSKNYRLVEVANFISVLLLVGILCSLIPILLFWLIMLFW